MITLHELGIGILLTERRDAQQGAVFRVWLETQVLPAFEGRILSIDAAVAQRAARLHVPDPQPIHDAFIAATALVHGMPAVPAFGGHRCSPWHPQQGSIPVYASVHLEGLTP